MTKRCGADAGADTGVAPRACAGPEGPAGRVPAAAAGAWGECGYDAAADASTAPRACAGPEGAEYWAPSAAAGAWGRRAAVTVPSAPVARQETSAMPALAPATSFRPSPVAQQGHGPGSVPGRAARLRTGGVDLPRKDGTTPQRPAARLSSRGRDAPWRTKAPKTWGAGTGPAAVTPCTSAAGVGPAVASVILVVTASVAGLSASAPASGASVIPAVAASVRGILASAPASIPIPVVITGGAPLVVGMFPPGSG